MRGRLADYYAVLGVAREVSAGELRRAYRLLALRYHPDRAGEGATLQFQQISEAYAVLSDPSSRAAYDGLLQNATAHRQAQSHARAGVRRADRAQAAGGNPTGGFPGGFEEGLYEGPGGYIGWRRARRAGANGGRLLERISGALEDLLARAVARREADGVIELALQAEEARLGGVAAIDARVTVRCPTCAGLAERHVLWCRRCEYQGTVQDDVTFAVEVPPAARDRTTFSFETDPSGQTPPLRLRLRVG